MKYIYILLLAMILVSCNSVKIRKKNSSSSSTSWSSTTPSSTHVYAKETTSVKTASGTKAEVLDMAKSYLGTPYKYGGSSSSGMDCSGLVFVSYQSVGKKLPRVSREMANEGRSVSLSDAEPGDLVFFNTSGNGISHVGIVQKVENNEVYFIHSSSSKGVIISSIEESYWKSRFVKAKRID